ncbi:MAG: hypothetical protein JWN17_2119 [Frankiales bacterium]|nr:hypothetical protein [Frankiales bacterium]
MSDDDLDRLFLAGAETAARRLAVRPGLYPFALAMTVDGRLVAPGIEPGEERPAVERVQELLVEALRAVRDDLRAVVLVSDVRLVSEADGAETPALLLELEPRDGDPVVVTVPYAPGPELQQPTRAAGRRSVWDPAG